jgi:hypothetical protein
MNFGGFSFNLRLSDLNVFNGFQSSRKGLFGAYPIVFILLGIIFILVTLTCFLLGLSLPIVGGVLLGGLKNERNNNIQQYANVVNSWNSQFYPTNKDIIMETITTNRNDSFDITNINDIINDRPAPFYVPIQYKNLGFSFISSETFNSISMFSTLVYYKTKSNPTRIRFKNPIIDDKFKTEDIEATSFECQNLEGFAFTVGKCRLFYKMKSLCVVLYFETLEHETCPGEKKYSQYEKIPYSQINTPQNSVGEFMFRESHDPFVYLHKASNGKLTFGVDGNPAAGIALIVIGSIFLFLLCVVFIFICVLGIILLAIFTEVFEICFCIFCSAFI